MTNRHGLQRQTIYKTGLLICHLQRINNEFSTNYRRDRISNFLISALEKSGRNEEVLPLCAKEAKITGSWERYVERLVGTKKYDEARKAAEEGIQLVGQKYPGIASTLREHIAKLAEKSGDYDSIVFLRQEEFLDSPCLENYNKLIEAAAKTKNEATIRDWALIFLETGNAQTKGELKNPPKGKERYSKSFPAYDVLIDIADKEKDADMVLHWYKKSYARSQWFSEAHAQVARAIAGKYPDEALKIWFELSENQIALTKPSAYETAVGYLKQVQAVWDDVYINELVSVEAAREAYKVATDPATRKIDWQQTRALRGARAE